MKELCSYAKIETNDKKLIEYYEAHIHEGFHIGDVHYTIVNWNFTGMWAVLFICTSEEYEYLINKGG